MSLWFSTLTVLVTSMHFSPSFTERRMKRVINGVPVYGRDGVFKSVMYYVWIGNGHNCDIPIPESMRDNLGIQTTAISFGNVFNCRPSTRNFVCSGSLLSPKIVQTACHCLARLEERDGDFKQPVLRNVFEELFQAFPGFNEVALMEVNGINAKYYSIHPECKRHHYLEIDIYDFGIMYLAEPVNKYQQLKISYAPVYPRLDIADMWSETLERQYACLHLGFGHFDNSKKPSPIMRYGWRYTLNYVDCYQNVYYYWDRLQYSFEYKKHCSWACSVSATPVQQQFSPSHGDSGGPVTCNNEYFAVVSGGINDTPHHSWSGTIVYTLYENSAEYRRAFLANMEEHTKITHPLWATPAVPDLPVDRTFAAKSIARRVSEDLLYWTVMTVAIII